MKTVPYVITEDIRTISSQFSECRVKDVTAEHISKSIMSHCEKFVNKNVQFLYEKELTEWVAKVATPNIVIQTFAYAEGIKSKFALNITRAVNEDLNNIGLRPRNGYYPIEVQLKNLGLFVDHTLLEDVIYTGERCKEIVEIGKGINVFFDKIITCVTTGNGKKMLESLNLDVVSLHHFESVSGAVCQRDFIPGFPYSGRTVFTRLERYYYVPYLLPWGNLTEWANIPKKNAVDFSKACIATAIEFWEDVNSSILFSKVPAVLYDFQAYPSDLRFIDYLHKCYKAL